MRIGGNDPRSHIVYSAPARRSVFQETLGRNIGKATGMDPQDVYRIAAQADNVGIVKYQETVCLHMDMERFLNPILDEIMANKVSPKEGAVKLQAMSDKRLPELFKRWVRNMRFTGADRNFKRNHQDKDAGGLI